MKLGRVDMGCGRGLCKRIPARVRKSLEVGARSAVTSTPCAARGDRWRSPKLACPHNVTGAARRSALHWDVTPTLSAVAHLTSRLTCPWRGVKHEGGKVIKVTQPYKAQQAALLETA
jgi:hypothetical protein